MNRLRYILQHRYYLKIITLVLILLIFLYTKILVKRSVYNENIKEVTGIIYNIKNKDDKRLIYLKAKEKIIIYDYEMINDYSLGDTINVVGEIRKPSNNTTFNLFNYKKYLYYLNIHYYVISDEITLIKRNNSVFYYIKEKIRKRINNIFKSSEYLNTFILGDNSEISDDVLDSYRANGISHVFSISGMHISLFAALLLYIMKRLSYNNYLNYLVVITFLFFYIFLVNFSVSALRSFIMYVLFSLNKLYNLKINKIDIMLLLLLIMLMINPYYLYNMSFQYSYIISLTLIAFNYKLKNKSNFVKCMMLSFYSFLVSLPITVYNFCQVNILSIIYNLVIVPFISFIIFPLSLISFIVPMISYVLNIFVNILEFVSLLLSNSKIGILSFSMPNMLIIILYYFLIYLFMYNYKYFYIFILLFLHKFFPYFDIDTRVVYFDVSQGDSNFISYPCNSMNILIDTGGNEFSKSSFVLSRTIPYLKSIGKSKINYLVITHGDFDHMGEAINLVNNFKVENVIFNCGKYNELEQELISVLEKKNINYYSCIKELNIDKYKLQLLKTGLYDNENDNSSVIYFNYNNYKFLFMGDASVEREKDILEKYNLSNIDFLKVGHHGSNTSSSEEFINSINPKYSLISVGKNNRYGHPKKEVLDTLKNSKIYRTDLDGSIEIKLGKSGYKIRTCPP